MNEYKKARTKKDLRNDPRVEEFSRTGRCGGWVIVLKEGWRFSGEVPRDAVHGSDGRGRNRSNVEECCDDLNNTAVEVEVEIDNDGPIKG